MHKRVLLAGLFHETHTFLDGMTPLSEFSIRRGNELLSAAGDGSPLSGALEVAAACGWDVRPVVDLRATPSATVEDEVFEFFWREFAAAYERERGAELDGVFLVLHGAMACASVRDVEGELIDRIRALPGARELPVCGVLDLHGNLSRRTIEQTQGSACRRAAGGRRRGPVVGPSFDDGSPATKSLRIVPPALAADRDRNGRRTDANPGSNGP